MQHTNVLESINVDEEAMQFYVNYSVLELWKSAFADETETVRTVQNEGANGNKFHDKVVDTFLSDYDGAKGIEIPKNYKLLGLSNFMERYVAYKVITLPYFGNFSGTGAGKTLSAILASRIIDSKLTVIICPNDVVEQWRRGIIEIFPNSKVITGTAAFSVKYLPTEYQYIVLNYDKFSQEDSPNKIITIIKQWVDFVIFDEIHFTKIRSAKVVSQRRENLDGLMTGIKRKNRDVKVLGLSATPVVNNLREGRSMLEIITSKIYDDISIKPTIPNAVALFEKLSMISVRELPRDYSHKDVHFLDVVAKRPESISVKNLKSNPLAIEKFLTETRLPEILRSIEGQTIIYTEYVEDIIGKLVEVVKKAGHSCALYTGFDRTGLSQFLSKKIQVLIASRPLSVGIDGLQHICNRLIINTLPWTNAQYQQCWAGSLGRANSKTQLMSM